MEYRGTKISCEKERNDKKVRISYIKRNYYKLKGVKK